MSKLLLLSLSIPGMSFLFLLFEAAEGELEEGEVKEGTTTKQVIGDSIRVSLRKIDGLMNVVGELSLVRAELEKIYASLRRINGTGVAALELHKTGRAFDRHLKELQQGIMDVRLVPLRFVFDRLLRTSRRTARDVGKDIRFIVSGEDTELDKVLIEKITDFRIGNLGGTYFSAFG